MDSNPASATKRFLLRLSRSGTILKLQPLIGPIGLVLLAALAYKFWA